MVADKVPDYAHEMAKAILDEDWAKAKTLAEHYEDLKSRLEGIDSLLQDLNRRLHKQFAAGGSKV